MAHKFGVVLFHPLTDEQIAKGNALFAADKEWDPEDPFCIDCGQKYIQADKVCQGRDPSHFLNPPQLIVPEEVGG